MTRKSCTDGLTDAQRRFADEYLVDFNMSAAYGRAGFKSRGDAVRFNSSRLLHTPQVQDYLRVRQAELSARLGVSAEEVLRRVAAQGLGDIRGLFDPTGALKSMADLSVDEQALIQGIEVTELYGGSGEERVAIGLTKKIRLIDRHAAAKTLGTHFGLFSTRVEHTGKDGGPIKTETTVLDALLNEINGAGTGLPPPIDDATANT